MDRVMQIEIILHNESFNLKFYMNRKYKMLLLLILLLKYELIGRLNSNYIIR